MNVRPISRGLPWRDPQPSGWWCPRCCQVVDGPWHEQDCPLPDREVVA